MTPKEARQIVETKEPKLEITGCFDFGDYYAFPMQPKKKGVFGITVDCWRNVDKCTGEITPKGHQITELMKASEVGEEAGL